MIAHSNPGLLRVGGVGVDVFFALSGYLITSILISEFDRFQSISLFNFYSRRFLRLVPCLVLAIVFVGIEQRIAYGVWPVRNLLLSIGYMMNWARAMKIGNHFPLGHTWSLAIEEQFYLIWPILILFVCRASKSKAVRCVSLVGLAVALSAYRVVMTGHYSADRIYYGSDTHSDGLVLGSALAFFIVMLPDGRLPERYSKLVGRVIAPFAVLTIAAIVARTLLWESSMGRFVFIAMSMSSVLIVLDLVAGSNSVLQLLLSNRPAIWIGQISYGLYLWHLPIYHTIADLHSPKVALMKLLVGIPVSIGVAALSYYTVEKKILQLKGKFVRTPEPAVEALRAFDLNDKSKDGPHGPVPIEAKLTATEPLTIN